MGTDRDTINQEVIKLLSRFSSVDMDKLVEEAQSINTRMLIDSGVMKDDKHRVKVYLIALMESLLTMALGGKPKTRIPKNVDLIKEALILFLQLNHTADFYWTEDDTPESWAFRALDNLFLSFARRSLLDHKDYMVLTRIADLKVWEQAFGTAMELYLKSHSNEAVVAALDARPVKTAVTAFQKAMSKRHAAMPSTRYGGSGSDGMKQLTQYAIRLYFDGANINAALREMLVVQTTDHTADQIEAILQDNRLTKDQFPVTIRSLNEIAVQEVTYKTTEAEAIAVCCRFAERQNRLEDVTGLFENFTDGVFPVAIKVNQLFNFGFMSPKQSANLIARWMRVSESLVQVRKQRLEEQVGAVTRLLPPEERKGLLLFRNGMTDDSMFSRTNVEQYAKARLRQIYLDAEMVKLKRVQWLLDKQMRNAQRFMMMPGREILKGLTYGIESFFRLMNSVFTHIFEDIAGTHYQQNREMQELRTRIGPLSTLSIFVPKETDKEFLVWLSQSKTKLAEIPKANFD